jgi:hypothetical protein
LYTPSDVALRSSNAGLIIDYQIDYGFDNISDAQANGYFGEICVSRLFRLFVFIKVCTAPHSYPYKYSECDNKCCPKK